MLRLRHNMELVEEGSIKEVVVGRYYMTIRPTMIRKSDFILSAVRSSWKILRRRDKV